MSKRMLISFTGKMPVEVDLPGGTLTLRQNTTNVVSESDLEAVKKTLGDRAYQRYVCDHGEYKPRKGAQAPPVPKPEPQPEPAPEPPKVTVSGKGKRSKGK